MRTTTHDKKRHLFIGVGGTRTHAHDLLLFRGIQRLYRLSYDSDTVFPTYFFILTITLMIQMTTELIPSGFLAYNQLLKALTGLMVIAYVIMIGKLI